MSKNGATYSAGSNSETATAGSYGVGPSDSSSIPSSREDDKPSTMTTLNGELMKSKIFVGGIAQKTTDEDLKAFFGAVAPVQSVRIITDPSLQSKSGEPRRYAFVEFNDPADVRRILATYSDKQSLELDGRRLNVAPAYRRQPTFGRTFGPSSPPHGGYPSPHENLSAAYSNAQTWMMAATPTLPGVGHQLPGYYSGMQYPYMSPQIPYYPGIASQPSALQYAQAAFLSSAMMQQLQQSSSSPLGPRSLGQTGNSSAHNSINALDLSDLENSEVFAANIHRDFNAIQRQQHDIANDFANHQALMQHQQPQQLDFRPSVSGQPGDRYQQRQGTGRTRSTGYGQQRIFGSDNQQVFQGNSPHHIGRMNQVGSYQGRNTSHQAGIHGQSSAMGNGRTPSNLLSFPQQQHY